MISQHPRTTRRLVPVCGPTRAALLTGRHYERQGIPTANSGRMLNQEITLAELAQTQGYRTGHFGKWHLGALTRDIENSNRGTRKNHNVYSAPWHSGFDTVFSTEARVPTFWNESGLNSYNEFGTRYWTGPGEFIVTSSSPPEIRGDDSKVVMDPTIDFIRDAVNDDQPFFAVTWLHTPHAPVVLDPTYQDDNQGFSDTLGTSGTYSDPTRMPGGFIPAGTVVDSFLIHGQPITQAMQVAVTIEFDNEILGVIADNGKLVGSDYLTFRDPMFGDENSGRGALESTDNGWIIRPDGRTLDVFIHVAPDDFDQFRVVTRSSLQFVPEPTAHVLMALSALSLLTLRNWLRLTRHPEGSLATDGSRTNDRFGTASRRPENISYFPSSRCAVALQLGVTLLRSFAPRKEIDG